jgi:hypothetical protein
VNNLGTGVNRSVLDFAQDRESALAIGCFFFVACLAEKAGQAFVFRIEHRVSALQAGSLLI